MTSSTTTLSAPGPRILVPLSEATAILSKWTAQLDAPNCPAITTLDLSCRAWPLETLLVLEPALVRIAPTVTYLKLDDIIASLETEDGFATLGFFNRIFAPDKAPNLTRLDLSDNALGTRSLDVIPNLLENAPKLAELSLHNCGMSLEVAAQLSARLGGETKSGDDGEESAGGEGSSGGIAEQLQALYLGRNQMGPEGAASFGKLLSQCTALRKLSYAGSRARSTGTRALMEGLLQMAKRCPDGLTQLVELDLDDCSFGTGDDDEADALIPLCGLIRSSPKLTKLILKDGGLGPEGFDLLVDALVTGKCQIRYLDVGCLDLEEDGTAALAKYIEEHLVDTLEELHLETNLMEDAGLAKLLPVLAKCTKLTVLNLTENGLEEDGYRALAETKMPTLKKLIMKENCEEDVEDEEVKDAIRKMYSVVLMADDDEDTGGADEEEEEGEEEKEGASGREAAADDALAGAIGSLQI